MTVIKAENISKLYRLGQVGTGTIRHDLNRWWARVRGKEDPFAKIGTVNDRTSKSNSEYVWALKDINFEINEGDAVGIIGRNGAGKSTLLKLLSKVTKPTSGSFKVKGRIASLLEVGTGFHPEMTGRENIYMNGAILGMRKKEIARKFDEILDFSGCEMYIDTPVKRYSSGMYVRLAFAVAAHLECEIMIVDEVLAVGDAEFQKKCLGKMQDVSREQGRTVLFVSHNLGAVQNLCNKGILLEYGFIKNVSSDIKYLIRKYLNVNNQNLVKWEIQSNQMFKKNNYFIPHKIYIADENFNSVERVVSNDEQIGVVIEGELIEINNLLTIGFAIYSQDSVLMYWAYATDQPESDWPKLQVGYNKLIGWLPKHFLNEGEYSIHLLVSIHCVEWIYLPLDNAPYINFTIKGGLSQSPLWHSMRPGLMAPIIKFQKF